MNKYITIMSTFDNMEELKKLSNITKKKVSKLHTGIYYKIYLLLEG